MALKIDYKDDILTSEARKFNLIQNTDGTISLEDVSEYQQIGDTFGAKDVNETNTTVNQLTENLTTLQSQMASFESTKSDIVGSALGTALSLTASTTWANIVSKIKAIVNRGAVSQALNAGGSYTIPSGYHNGSGKVTANSLASQTSATATAANIASGKTAWVNGSKLTGSHTCPTLAGLVGTSVTLASAANLLSGVTAIGANGVKYTGTNKGYDAGYSAGVTAADNRTNVNSANYKAGYNNGYNVGVSAAYGSVKQVTSLGTVTIEHSWSWYYGADTAGTMITNNEMGMVEVPVTKIPEILVLNECMGHAGNDAYSALSVYVKKAGIIYVIWSTGGSDARRRAVIPQVVDSNKIQMPIFAATIQDFICYYI